jgi:hypothetical protein
MSKGVDSTIPANTSNLSRATGLFMSSGCTCQILPDNHIETRFDADGTGTLMTMRMTLPVAEMRAAMLATGMVREMEASYVRPKGMI